MRRSENSVLRTLSYFVLNCIMAVHNVSMLAMSDTDVKNAIRSDVICQFCMQRLIVCNFVVYCILFCPLFRAICRFSVQQYCCVCCVSLLPIGVIKNTNNNITEHNQKGDNYSNVLPLKAARRNSISNLTYLGFESELQTNPMPFNFQSRCGAPR